MRKRAIPHPISETMYSVFLSGIRNPLLALVQSETPDSETAPFVEYADARRFLEKKLDQHDERFLEKYLGQCLATLRRQWMEADRETSRWLLNGNGNSSQKRALMETSTASPPRIEQKEYVAFAPIHRTFLANYAEQTLDEPVLKQFFDRFPYWNDTILRDARQIEDDAVVRFLRTKPDWRRMLDKQNYKEAEIQYRTAWKILSGGTSLPLRIERRMSGMIEAERALWESQISQTTWEYLVRSDSPEKGEITPKKFWTALLELLPKEKRTEKQRALIAACMINRGIEPAAFEITGIDATVLKKYFPEEEPDGN
jgi:hypothetical protein